MLSKNQIKLITSLKHKKFRQEHGIFVAEGVKTIQEFLNAPFELVQLFSVKPFNIDAKFETLITEQELKRISFLKTPNQALALFKIPNSNTIDFNNLIVVLDAVRDPGNLGTIIRLCDWFGIPDLICSETTVDAYNPKVIQATMGSLTRVNITYSNLDAFLEKTTLPIFGAFMDGNNVYQESLPKKGVLVLGNEANGISKSLEEKISQRIAIPRFGAIQKTESLNVATAAAILISEFKR